ncbi:MAG: hypothetical protein M1832_001581 [Thelocarpon impressellum]|nr:MAG: hypothetical protein M1832_001581 [Thelocarpon impressellum]
MAPLRDVRVNGHAMVYSREAPPVVKRFSDIPLAIDIPVQGLDAEEAVEVNLEDLLDDPTELCTLLENEGAARTFWMVVALAYAKQRKMDHAIEMLNKGLTAVAKGGPKEKLSMLTCLCWLYLWKSRESPRTSPGESRRFPTEDEMAEPHFTDGALASEAKTKDYYLRASTSSLNEASRINPSFPPLFLARGVLYLLRASLQAPSTHPVPGSQQDQSERAETLRQAAKCFEDALRVSGGKNMMAVLGRSRVHYSMGRYPAALEGYQLVMSKMPGLVDPDPRIGAGCCFWQLGFKDDAKNAWERALAINPDSKAANILLGIYHLDSCARLPTTDPRFIATYKRAMTSYTQKAFKLDQDHPLTCATFGGYFLSRRAMSTVESLAWKAIDNTDVNAIASDGWYLLARKEHFMDELARAAEYYRKADEARGGGDKGYVPAKFGTAQLQVLNKDFDGAKFRLEKIVQRSKNAEAMALLGALYAEDVFASQAGAFKEDRSSELKKAVALMETVRVAWKDPKKTVLPDATVLLNLARLYEKDHPEKSLQCLRELEELEMDKIRSEDPPADAKDEDLKASLRRERLSPQLLNNMGCFMHHTGKNEGGRELFQAALNACVNVAGRDETIDTDALATTISYNLARSYEAAGLLEEAKAVYEGLLERHGDYTDALTRQAYIALIQSPNNEGPRSISKLVQIEPGNLEVRALYAWFLSRSKKRTANIAEDSEQRHHKHTLQHHDKHDRYALTGMGNLFLATAREMRRESESDRDKRRKMYEKAVEFYDKALLLDARNAYAAQGIAIALAEDRKEHAAALQIFSKVRETVKDSSVLISLGHSHAELKQYARAIENYEGAVAKDRAHDPQILACLGRVWLLKGKHEKSISAMKQSLTYSQQALELDKEQIVFHFNVAFVQIQVAQLLYTLSESQRSLEDVQMAAEGLDEAIESFDRIAKSKNPPYPRNDLELRADMGRNTMRRQLERAVQSQREYEENNAAKLQRARELREAELKQREDDRIKVEQAALERKRRIAEERLKMQERDRELAEKRAEEERATEEAMLTTDSETGEKKKRAKRGVGKRRKKDDDKSGTDEDDAGSRPKKARRRKSATRSGAATSDEEGPAPKKRRKLERKGGAQSKYKSSEIVVDSDSDGATGAPADDGSDGVAASDAAEGVPDVRLDEDDASEDEDAVQQRSARKKKVSRAVGSDSEDDGEPVAPLSSPGEEGADGDRGDGDMAMSDADPSDDAEE